MATAEWADVWIEILSYLGIAWFAAGVLLRVITGFGVIVDIIAIPLAAAPDKIYRTIKRNDSRIFRHIRQIQSLMQIYGKILSTGFGSQIAPTDMFYKIRFCINIIFSLWREEELITQLSAGAGWFKWWMHDLEVVFAYQVGVEFQALLQNGVLCCRNGAIWEQTNPL